MTRVGADWHQWRRYYAYIFDQTDLAGARVLDIGGGTGHASYFAAAAGAREVICLEPEAAGSNDAMLRHARAIGDHLRTGNTVQIIPKLLQEFEDDLPFDIILLHNSINHFDEAAVPLLGRDDLARRRYAPFVQRLHDLARPGADLLVVDCSSRNLFGDLGCRNPIAATINWRIHQKPEVWVDLFGAHGFSDPTIRWTSDRRLPHLAPLLRNRWMAYLLQSHFCLQMRRSHAPARQARP